MKFRVLHTEYLMGILANVISSFIPQALNIIQRTHHIPAPYVTIALMFSQMRQSAEKTFSLSSARVQKISSCAKIFHTVLLILAFATWKNMVYEVLVVEMFLFPQVFSLFHLVCV